MQSPGPVLLSTKLRNTYLHTRIHSPGPVLISTKLRPTDLHTCIHSRALSYYPQSLDPLTFTHVYTHRALSYYPLRTKLRHTDLHTHRALSYYCCIVVWYICVLLKWILWYECLYCCAVCAGIDDHFVLSLMLT